MSERSSSGVDDVVTGEVQVDIVKSVVDEVKARPAESALEKDDPHYWRRAFSYLAGSIDWHDDDAFGVIVEDHGDKKVYYIVVELGGKETMVKLVDLSERPRKLPRIFLDRLVLENLEETFIVGPGVNGAPRIDLNTPIEPAQVLPAEGDTKPDATAPVAIHANHALPFPLKVLQHFDFDDIYLAPIINFHIQVIKGLEKGLDLFAAAKRAEKILRLDLFRHVGLDHAEQFMDEHFREFLRVYVGATFTAEQDYDRNRIVRGKDIKNLVAQPLLSAGLVPRRNQDTNASYGHTNTFGFISVVVSPGAYPYSLAISPDLPISSEVRAKNPLLAGYSNGTMKFGADRVLEMLELYDALRADVLSWLPEYRKEMNAIGYKLVGPKHTTAVCEHPDLGRRVSVSSYRDEDDAQNDSHYRVWVDLLDIDFETRELILFYAERASVKHEIGGNHVNIYFKCDQLASLKELAQKLHEIMSKRVTIAE